MSDRDIVLVMSRVGGGFAQALAEAWLKADTRNQARIRDAFPELWAKYWELAKLELEARDRDIVLVMSRVGGGFAQGLAEAWLKADTRNQARIRDAFPELWAKYWELAKLELEARR
jgi:hypothetical protein